MGACLLPGKSLCISLGMRMGRSAWTFIRVSGCQHPRSEEHFGSSALVLDSLRFIIETT